MKRIIKKIYYLIVLVLSSERNDISLTMCLMPVLYLFFDLVGAQFEAAVKEPLTQSRIFPNRDLFSTSPVNCVINTSQMVDYKEVFSMITT